MASTFDTSKLQGRFPGMALAGQQTFGSVDGDLFGGFLQGYEALRQKMEALKLPKEEQETLLKGYTSGMPSASDKLVQGILQQQQYQSSPEYQEKMLEMADKYQTRKGWKGAMFNTLTGGIQDLTRGIAMSMNPYGTPEAARYAADMTAAIPEMAGRSFQNFRTPYAIPAVQVQQAATYF